MYIFFDEPINSADLRTQLCRLLTLNGFKTGKGHLEIFPHPGNQESLGLGLRLPMQSGFAWLDKQTLDVDFERHELSPTKALELFIDALESGSNSYSDFRNLKTHIEELASRKEIAKRVGANLTDTKSNVVPIRTTRRSDEPSEFKDFVNSVFHKLPPGIIVDNWYKGRLYHLNGLTGPSQRAEAIECLGHYLFYGDPSRDLPALGYGYEQERQWAIEEFLHANNNGQSKDINRGRADAIAQVERAANWRPAHKASSEPTKFTAKRPVSWIRANANKSADARKRISHALDELKSEERSFTTEELRKKARCGRETLYKHDDIWRNDYEDLAEGFFAICTDEYNDVVEAASSQSKPPSTSSEKIMPPGRLAARRIVYELSMRSKREQKQNHNASLSAQDASESTWMDEVLRLTEKDLSNKTIAELKALLTVLVMYLSKAPNYECQIYLQPHIDNIKKSLTVPSDPSISIVKPP